MTTPAPTLPALPSALIRTATADARALDRDLYLPYHGEWHLPRFVSDEPDDERQVCEVCTAGAVVAGTLARQWHEPTDPADFDEATTRRLLALNQFRQGHVEAGCNRMGRMPPPRSDKLDALALACAQSSDFCGWARFDRNLDALDALADYLEDIGH